MHKDEMLNLHGQMATVKELLLQYDDITEDDFEQYNELDVTHEDDREPKNIHQHAIFVLGSEIADVISDGPMSEADKIGNRMQELAEQTIQDAEGEQSA